MWNRNFRLIIPEPPESRLGLATMEAKSAQWWIITMMLAPLAPFTALVLVFYLPIAVTMVSAWKKPSQTYWWRCAVILTLVLTFSASARMQVDGQVDLVSLLLTWGLENFVLSLFLTLPLAAASTWETWSRKRQAKLVRS